MDVGLSIAIGSLAVSSAAVVISVVNAWKSVKHRELLDLKREVEQLKVEVTECNKERKRYADDNLRLMQKLLKLDGLES